MEQATETGGNPGGEAASVPAGGSSFLSEAASGYQDQGAPAEITTPTGDKQAADTADSITQEVLDGPPEYVPEKFWKKDSKEVDVEALGTGYKNLEKLLSRDKVPVPQGEDDQEGYERWISAVRPESEEDYDFGSDTVEKSVSEAGMSYDSELEQSFRNAAYSNGLHPKQAKGLHELYVKTQMERHRQWQKMQEEAKINLQNDLQREYGHQLPAMKQRVGQLIKKYSDPDFDQYLEESGQGNDPRMIRFLDRMAKDMSGERRLIGKPTEVAQPQDLDAAISQFNAKHQKALFDRNHPDHQRLVAERQRLFEARYPERSA